MIKNDVIYVNYEKYINEVKSENERIAKGLNLKFQPNKAIPKEKLKLSSTQFIPKDQFEKIEKLILEYYGENHSPWFFELWKFGWILIQINIILKKLNFVDGKKN